MDLACNHKPEFTNWVVSAGVLAEPFVLIDVGVQGGESIRWRSLGDYLVVHGFDPIEEVVKELTKASRRGSNRHYYCMALGNSDGEQAFYFNTANPTASSMYPQSTGRFEVDLSEECRKVPIRRMDSLWTQGVIPIADYVKIDVEGFEQDVLLGAREVLAAGVLALQTETNFAISPSYPDSHFASVAKIALQNHLVVFDLAFNRIPRASFQRALVHNGCKPISELDVVGSPATVDVLFARNLIDEVDRSEHYQRACPPFSINQLIKSMIICELHALNDIAVDTAERFADRLGAHLDVERAVRLLADSDCVTNEYRKQLRAQRRAYEESTCWRVTAPLRRTKHLFSPPLRASGGS